MRSNIPTLNCDGDYCDNWSVDYYEGLAHEVAGVRITLRQRAPGWVSTDDTDLCPECYVRPAVESVTP